MAKSPKTKTGPSFLLTLPPRFHVDPKAVEQYRTTLQDVIDGQLCRPPVGRASEEAVSGHLHQGDPSTLSPCPPTLQVEVPVSVPPYSLTQQGSGGGQAYSVYRVTATGDALLDPACPDKAMYASLSAPLKAEDLGSAAPGPVPYASDRLPRFGVEYTFVDRRKNIGFDHLVEVASQLNKAMGIEELDPQREARGQQCAHPDGGAIEFPSPVHSNLEEAKLFWHKLAPEARKLGLVPRLIERHPDGSETYHGTGGGHVHVELPAGPGWSDRKRCRLMLALIAWVSNRPWLGWVFNEWMDDINARSPVGKAPVRRMLAGKLRVRIAPNGDSCMSVEEEVRYLVGKDWAINFSCAGEGPLKGKGKAVTAEFRFFDAPRSWGMARDHIEFARAVMAKCTSEVERAEEIEVRGATKALLKKFHSREAVEEDFEATVRSFGLKWSRYRKYMANFDDRKSFGRLV